MSFFKQINESYEFMQQYIDPEYIKKYRTFSVTLDVFQLLREQMKTNNMVVETAYSTENPKPRTFMTLSFDDKDLYPHCNVRKTWGLMKHGLNLDHLKKRFVEELGFHESMQINLHVFNNTLCSPAIYSTGDVSYHHGFPKTATYVFQIEIQGWVLQKNISENQENQNDDSIPKDKQIL